MDDFVILHTRTLGCKLINVLHIGKSNVDDPPPPPATTIEYQQMVRYRVWAINGEVEWAKISNTETLWLAETVGPDWPGRQSISQTNRLCRLVGQSCRRRNRSAGKCRRDHRCRRLDGVRGGGSSRKCATRVLGYRGTCFDTECEHWTQFVGVLLPHYCCDHRPIPERPSSMQYFSVVISLNKLIRK